MTQLDLLIALVYQVTLKHFGSVKTLPKHSKAKLRKFALDLTVGLHKLDLSGSASRFRLQGYLEDLLVDDTKWSKERLINYINKFLYLYNKVYKERI